MQAKDLIGHLAIRTKPVNYGNGREDYSYTNEPLMILAATDTQIVCEYPDGWMRGKTHILDCRWNDNNWTDYEELMRMANCTKAKLSAQTPKNEEANSCETI